MASTFNLCIDLVVLPVRADEPDIDDAIRIIDPHHDAILVAGDVEHRATVVENARVADVSLHVRRRRPIGSSNLPVPGQQRLTRISIRGTSADEGFERAERNDPHGMNFITVPPWDQPEFRV